MDEFTVALQSAQWTEVSNVVSAEARKKLGSLKGLMGGMHRCACRLTAGATVSSFLECSFQADCDLPQLFGRWQMVFASQQSAVSSQQSAVQADC